MTKSIALVLDDEVVGKAEFPDDATIVGGNVQYTVEGDTITVEPPDGHSFLDDEDAQVGWIVDGGEAEPPPPGGIPQAPRQITPLAFWLRLDSTKRQAILASTNGPVRDFLYQMSLVEMVDTATANPGGAFVQAGVDAIVAAGLLTEIEGEEWIG